MRTNKLFLCAVIFCSAILQNKSYAEYNAQSLVQNCAEPVICDPMQAIAATMEIDIPPPVLMDLKKRGIEELSITPVMDFCWTKTLPVENGAKLTLVDNADPLTVGMNEGYVVTYKTGAGPCAGQIVYAFCKMSNDCLKGEYPKNVKLHLTPVLGQCEIEVLCTQCS
ncbi:MAG TPA: hypothetical protein VMW10_11830 [Alphaproteobacteria bacterium]|nr:hypothetical protein [Alphaproteobacteria bacterium]